MGILNHSNTESQQQTPQQPSAPVRNPQNPVDQKMEWKKAMENFSQ